MPINWNAPRYVETNGIRMAVYEQGSGVPVVLCHGFPELAYSWRHQIPAIAQAGFHAIAPDQRGYGHTDRPEPIESYDIHHLTGDLIGMLDAMKIEKAIFCGHDWGGFVVWQMPLLHPNRVAGVIGVNTPFLPRAPMDPIALMRAAYGEEMYIVFFQKPGVADAILGKDVAKTLRLFYRKSGMTIEEFEKRPAEEKNLALVRALELDESLWPGKVLLTPEELDVYHKAFGRTGFTGGINWYRNFTRNWHLMEGVEQKVNVPSLMVMAENDIVLRPSMADGMETFVPDLEKYLIKDCGHWTQSEKPQELNRAMVDWLKRRFGLSVATTGVVFFWTGLLSGCSGLLAPRLARRIGLVRTMVFTHLPANAFLVLAAFMPSAPFAVAALLLRSALSQMDVPARQSYVMAVVTPAERPAAASVTNVPRSLASALAPIGAGWLLDHSTFGWPLVIGGGLKAIYDVTLLVMFRDVRPPEEA